MPDGNSNRIVRVVWQEEDEYKVISVHRKRNRALLCGNALEKLVKNGQCKWLNKRVSAVMLVGMRGVSTYQLA